MGRGHGPTLTQVNQKEPYCVTRDSHPEKRSDRALYRVHCKGITRPRDSTPRDRPKTNESARSHKAPVRGRSDQTRP